MTSRKFTATIKEGERSLASRHAPVWILIESDTDIGLQPNKSITIQFPPDTSFETAKDVADALNDNASAFMVE